MQTIFQALSGHPRAAWFWRGVLLLLLAVISVLALLPAPPHELSLGWDKLNHCSAFFALAGVAYLGFGRAWLPVALALVGYGGLIEIAQSFTPNRSADWADLLADSVGIALGLLLAFGVARWASKKLN